MSRSPGAGALSTFEAVMMGFIGIAVLAVLLSKNAQTANVFTATASGIASMLGAAVAPVMGGGSANPGAPQY